MFKNYDEIPDSWLDRCSGEGYERYVDDNGNRRYKDNDTKLEDMPWRPCAKCGEYPTDDGDDACLQHLGNVMNACCGHGRNEGYIQFDCGIRISGYFKVERWK